MKKRILSILLALTMCLTLLPTAAFADETEGEVPVCTCETACAADAMNADCPVCGAEGAAAERCGRYTAPTEESDPAVAAVQALIDALPTVDTVTADDYDAVQDAYDAYDALTAEQQAAISGAEAFEALFAWFNAQTAPIEDEGGTETGYTAEGFCEAWEWTDGVLTKKDGATCSHENCNGYQPATLNNNSTTDDDSDDYYEIGNAGQLYWFAAKVNGTRSTEENRTAINGRLTADITVNSGTFDEEGGYTESGKAATPRAWTPIGTEKVLDNGTDPFNAYSGTFDGGGHTVSGLYYDRGSAETKFDNIGLFGSVCSATVKNVSLRNSYFGCDGVAAAGNFAAVGGIVGRSWCILATDVIEGCTVDSTTFCAQVGARAANPGTVVIGGIVGFANHRFTLRDCTTGDAVTFRCSVSELVQYGLAVGGIVGYANSSMSDAKIVNCHNRSAVDATTNNKGRANAGGIVGYIALDGSHYAAAVAVEGCRNSGAVSANAKGGTANAGGIVGYIVPDGRNNDAAVAVKGCRNSGAVSADASDPNDGTANAGGIAGYILSTGSAAAAKVEGCCNSGAVSATNEGGIAGAVKTTEGGSATAASCVYLNPDDPDDPDTTAQTDAFTSGTTGTTAAQFASGEVCYLLNGGTSEGTEEAPLMWYQTLGEDAAPVLDSKHGKVYPCNDEEGHYNNTAVDGAVVHVRGADNKCVTCDKTVCTHVGEDGKSLFDTDGVCTVCGASCPHTTIGDDGICTDCQHQMAIKRQTVVNGTTTTAWFDTVADAVEGVAENTDTQLCLYADVSADDLTDSGLKLLVDLNGHTLTANVTVQKSFQLKSQNSGGKLEGTVTQTGGVLILYGDDTTVTGLVTINDTANLLAGVTFEGGIKTTAEDKTLMDYLNGAAFATKDESGSYTVLTDGSNVQSFTEPVKVVAHTHNFTDGKCPCGYTCAHSTINDETGICTGCGYQYPVWTNLDACPWLESIDDVPFDNGVMYVFLYGDTGSGSTLGLRGYASRDTELTIELRGHTLKSNINATTTSGLPMALYIQNYDANGKATSGTFDGTINYCTDDDSFLAIGDGVTVTGKVTINGNGTLSGRVDLVEGATLAGGIETTVTGRILKDYLDDGTAFARKDTAGNYTVLVDSNVTEINEAVKVIEHKTHTFNSTTGKCACGAVAAVCVTGGSVTTGYESFADAYTAAQNGDTIKLFSNVTEAINIGKGITLDINGKTVSDLTVSVPATITDSTGGGTITALTTGGSVKIGGLLAAGYGFRTDGDPATWYDGSSEATSVSSVSVQTVPIKSLSISTNKTVYTYSEEVTLTANVTLADGVSVTPTYKWVDADSTNALDGTGASITLEKLAPNTQEYNIRCTATVDGYSLSNYIEFTVSKATLTENTDYTAPTAKTGLTYDGTDQELIGNEGSFGDDVTTDSNGPKFWYGLKNADNSISWSGTASGVTGRGAGTYTVYWYIAGGTNYNDVGSAENPAGTLTITIDKAAPTAENFTATNLTATYDGNAKAAKVEAKSDVNGMGAVTVKYFKDGNAVTAIDAETYTVKISVAEGTNYKATTDDLTADSWTFTIGKGVYNGEITASDTVISNQATTGKTLTLPALPAGASYGTPTFSDALISAASVSGTTLTYDVTSEAAGTTGTITVPVTGATNYNNYNVTVTITVVDKTPVTITGLTAATDLIYDGTARTGYSGTASFSPAWSGTLTVTYYLSDGTTKTTAANSGATGEGKAPVNAGSYKVVVAIPDSDTTYVGSTTIDFTIGKKSISNDENGGKTVVTLGPALTYNGTSQTQTVSKVQLDGVDITAFCNITNATQTNAGDFTLFVDAKSDSNYAGTTGKGFTIAPKSIAVSGATVSDKGYDGTANATVTGVSFDGLVNNETLELGTDYEVVSAAFPDADADENPVNVTVTVRLKDTTAAKNYTLSGGDYTAANAAKINKTELPDSEKPGNLSGAKGNKLSTVALPDSWTWDNGDAVMNTTGNQNYTASYAGSTNYKAKTGVTLTVNVVDKTDVSNKITFANGSLTYTGSALTFETATISGVSGGTWTYTYAAGTGTLNSDNKPLTAGTYTVTAKYEDATNIGTATATLTVDKATPTGAPKYTAITTSDKKLSDAGLAVNDGWPAGTVQWVQDDGVTALADTTEVTANTAYKWLFTPTDTANYNTLTGSITLWHRSSGGGSSAPVTPPTVTVPVSSDHATVEVKAEVSKGNATVDVSDKQIENVIADHAGEVTIDVSDLKNVESATVPSHVVEKTNEAENTGLTVALPAGSVTLDETALESVTENANGKDVAVSVVSVPTEKLPTAVKEVIGMEPTVVAVVDVNVTIGGKKQSSFDGGKVTISVPYTPKKGEDTSKLTVWFIRDDGTIENKGGRYDAEKKCFIFETTHLSRYLLVRVDEQFSDVPAGAYYAAAVNWAVAQNITNGIGDGKFGPDLGCTRAQIVTFLYRCAIAQGVDVTVGEDTNILSYADALEVPEYAVEAFQWACGAGIIQGADGKLLPNDDCTRAQIVTMLFRYAAVSGMEAVTMQELVSGFGDADSVPGYALPAFNWALAQGIVQGADGKLLPNDTCTRGQIVTMLYRANGK